MLGELEPESFLGFHTCTHSMYVNMSSHKSGPGCHISNHSGVLVMTNITGLCTVVLSLYWQRGVKYVFGKDHQI